MRGKILFLAVALVLVNCASYKQLKPKLALSSAEGGYREVKAKDKDFSINKNKKYYVEFPAPQDDYFYLIVTSPIKKKLSSYLTKDLTKGKPGAKIADETVSPDTMGVYGVDKSKPAFFWVIDNVPEKGTLPLRYRYAPQWRFKFENHYARYKETLARNCVDRSIYNGIGTSHHLENFNFGLVLDTVKKHTDALLQVQKELMEIESIFPKSILNSTDVAYLNYKKLKSEVEEEVLFQSNYARVVDFFYKESQTRGTTGALLGMVENFITYFEAKDKLPAHIVKESQEYLERRLKELSPFYDQRLGSKDDIAPLDSAYFRLRELNRVATLYTVSGVPQPAEYTAVAKFANDFDMKARGFNAARDSLESLKKQVKGGPVMPGNDFFRSVNARAGSLAALVPTGIDAKYGKFQEFGCAGKLNVEIGKLNTEVLTQTGLFREAEALVGQLNYLKDLRDYSAMIGLLKQKPQLGFLVEKYRELDKMSIDAQSQSIRLALESSSWPTAEAGLRKMSADQNFLDPSILMVRDAATRDYEDTLYSKVERVTRANVNKFCEDNITTFENIDSLYADSVFLPVYDITFSSGNRRDLLERKTALVGDLAKLKENEFPAKSIKLLYEQFIKTPDDNGVLKARAIVAHSKHYAGEDKDIKLRIAECDPTLAKWITSPKDYRRVFVMPVTDNKRGKNKYVLRLNVRIPTEAMFPVYDVNIKLPKEIAQNAAAAQWYDEMKLNKGLLKNEGRFTISAPTASNDWECQITPVQMNKDGNNILEVTFTSPTFKVFQVSVMVQKPLIKKN